MNTGLQNKVALITGASKGIGKAIAYLLAQEGARLALCARDDRLLKQTADEIQSKTHADIVALKANTTRLNDIRRFVNAAIKKYGRIDLLVNNAGGAHIGGLQNISDEDWEYHIQLKLLGYIRMAREVLPHMKQGGGGCIVNIVGMAAKEPSYLYTLPGVTNSALTNFTKTLSKELMKERIRVVSVNPPTTDTPLTEQTFKSLSTLLNKSPDEIRRGIEASFPQGRLASAEDIAKVVLFLASDAAQFVNGVSINLDAGTSAGVC